MMSIKRLHYYNHQFLDEKDFRDEQKYHVEMRRRLNHALHFGGVVEGLKVTRTGRREVTIDPGLAIDHEGRELVLDKPITCDVSYAERHTHLHVLIKYEDRFDEADRRSTGGVEGHVRVTESVEPRVTHESDKFGSGVLLATVRLDAEGNIEHVDSAARHFAGSVLAPHNVHSAHLADGCVTEEKLAPGLRESLQPEKFELRDGSVTVDKLSPDLRSTLGARGWVRLPFKPISIRPKGYRQRPDESDFQVDIAYAHCDGRGAQGTMAIPVPAGATSVREFRIAGTSRGRKIRFQLYRTGWNPRDRKGEFTEILNDEIFHAEFDVSAKAEAQLDEFHALSVAVFAEGEAEIWLVAARFQ